MFGFSGEDYYGSAVPIRTRAVALDSNRTGASLIENRMLGINYQVMGAWYRLNSRFSVVAARRALEEMAAMVAHMTNTVGEHAACAAAA
jgi:hypothetical protein